MWSLWVRNSRVVWLGVSGLRRTQSEVISILIACALSGKIQQLFLWGGGGGVPPCFPFMVDSRELNFVYNGLGSQSFMSQSWEPADSDAAFQDPTLQSYGITCITLSGKVVRRSRPYSREEPGRDCLFTGNNKIWEEHVRPEILLWPFVENTICHR